MHTEFDLVIFGATGFTGRLAAKYFMRPEICNGFRVAIAGRNLQKLIEVQAACAIKPEIVIADSAQPSSIDDMVQKTKVVLSFAGPFALYGEPVIAACVKFGKDYLDITGETPFIRSMIDKYQDKAFATGARLIPFSGFDSIPADASVYIALAAAKQHNIQLDEMCFYYQMQGGFNGGTLASALNMAEHSHEKALSPYNLIPEKPPACEFRAKWMPSFESALQRWTVPFFMGPINAAVVYRSDWLNSQMSNSNDHFQYTERMVMSKRFGFLKAVLTTGILIAFKLFTANSIGRKIIRQFGPKPGEGPSEENRRHGYFYGQLVCRSQGQYKLLVKMEGKGDPGNEITIALASESARLAVENAFLPARKGFMTPTFAFGDQLIKRLKAAGFRFSTIII